MRLSPPAEGLGGGAECRVISDVPLQSANGLIVVSDFLCDKSRCFENNSVPFFVSPFLSLNLHLARFNVRFLSLSSSSATVKGIR